MANTDRPSRRSPMGRIVGQPTNDNLSILNTASLLDYESALYAQLNNEHQPNEQRVEALIKSKEKLDGEKIKRHLPTHSITLDQVY